MKYKFSDVWIRLYSWEFFNWVELMITQTFRINHKLPIHCNSIIAFMIEKVGHLMINVQNISRCSRFFCSFLAWKCLNVHSVCTNFCLNVHGVCTNLCLNVHSPCLSCSPFEYGKGMYKFVFFANVHIVIEKLSQPWAAATSAAKSARFQVPKNGTSSAQI